MGILSFVLTEFRQPILQVNVASAAKHGTDRMAFSQYAEPEVAAGLVGTLMTLHVKMRLPPMGYG